MVQRAKDADAILINKVNITEEVLAQLPRLKYIGVLATGYNVVDVEAAHRHGVIVTNIPAYSTESVVQMTFAHILNITNRVAHYADDARNGRWSACPDFCYWDTPLIELAGKTLGIVGLGNIGLRVASVARHFGMDVFAVTSKDASSLPEGIQKTTLDGLLGISDIVTLHCPLTKDNYHLFDAGKVSRMRKWPSSSTLHAVRLSTSRPWPKPWPTDGWRAMEPTSWRTSRPSRAVRSLPSPTPSSLPT